MLNSRGKNFLRKIPIEVPIAIVKKAVRKYSARHKIELELPPKLNIFWIVLIRSGIWIAKSQKENPERYFAAEKSFSFFVIYIDNFKRRTMSIKTKKGKI